ncbi:caspase family protein [Rhizobium leguminosarum]|uniref:caspase family protein n=1 Tax=Rhizobium leguminosarum TaxID=384 RepID=UPI001C98A28E|nr:caspase family protein [Rhizobium leguminosarum]MBY5693638.1 caspase family protein [Rhizobium leguminosarum]
MERIALVIGNESYDHARELKTPIGDSIQVATILKGLGFDVRREENLNKTEMRRALEAFNDKIEDAEVALIYFSGHGYQIYGENYLLAIDSDIQKREESEAEATQLDAELTIMRSKAQCSLFFLDACRDNPFPNIGQFPGPRTRSVRTGNSGLAGVKVDRLRQAFVAFSAEQGKTAEDGEDLSPFTKAFVAHVGTAGLGVRDLMEKIRNAVYEETRGNQLPWSNDGLLKDFFFVPEILGKPGATNDLVVLFGGAAESSDFNAFRSLNAALDAAPSGSKAIVEPWLRDKPSLTWNSELEAKLLGAKKPLLVEYRGKVDKAKEDSRMKRFFYAVAGAQQDREDEFYDRSDRLLNAARTGDRLVWKPAGATLEERLLENVNATDVPVFAPFILGRLGVRFEDEKPLPCVATDAVPVLGRALARHLSVIVGVRDEPQRSMAMMPISFKRAAGGDDRLQNVVANIFRSGQANVVAACEPSGGNEALEDFLGGIGSRIVEGRRLARQRINADLCIVRFLARVDTKDERDAMYVDDDEWFVLRFARSEDTSYHLGNGAEAREWFKDSARRQDIKVAEME